MKNKNHNKLQIFIGLICFTLSLAFNACKKMDASYAEYIKDGEITYAHKADSLKLYSGQNRVKLSWLMANDNRVKRAVIYWNNRADSLLYTIQQTPGVNTIFIEIPNLTEGSYTFEVFTYDNKGNKSVKSDVSGNVYGMDYIAALTNRRIKSSGSKNSVATIDWFDAAEGAISVELNYKDKLGLPQKVLIPAKELKTVLPSYKTDSEISFRTLFLPNSTSMDTFYTASNVVTPQRLLEQMDKSKFSRWNPPGIPYSEYGAGYKIEMLWDNVYTAYGFMYNYTGKGTGPFSFTFDMGQKAELKSMKLTHNWQQQPYNNGNIKRCKVYGSATPNVNASLSTWTYLGEFNSIKPSGSALGTNTPEDLAYEKAGEDFNFIVAPAVRYIRVDVYETWKPANIVTAHTAEMDFSGYIED